MLIFNCPACAASLSADERQAGQSVRCPTCRTVLRVPQSELATAAAAIDSAAEIAVQSETRAATPATIAGAAIAATAAPATAPSSRRPPAPPLQSTARQAPAARNAGKRYGFNCVYCSSRLEAVESMAAQEGQCPTCGNTITIPILDRYGRLIDPVTKQIIKQDPHPVHAYAAAGERAPLIVRESASVQTIQCPRCKMKSPITSNNCKGCGMPFTMEGTTVEAGGASNGFCVASLVLGIISIPTGMMLVPPILAIIFGIVGLNQARRAGEGARGKGLAIAGLILGGIGMFIALWVYVLR